MHDLFGQKVEVGDTVAYIGTDYWDLDLGGGHKDWKRKTDH